MNDFEITARKARTDHETYQTHQIFSDIEYYIGFYESFSFSIMHFLTAGTGSIVNMDTYVYSSIQGTLESIKDTLKNGRIGDAYALIRKYYDSAIINIYTNLYLDQNISIEKPSVEKINNWLWGKEKLPEYKVMINYIRASDKMSSINKIFEADDRYKKIRDRCNDYTHYNFFENVLLNDNELYLKNRLRLLKTAAEDLKEIFILHLGYVFFLHGHYMGSSDYMDSLEMGETPQKDSQYWIAPFIQEAFDKVISEKRPEVTKVIKDNTSMHLS